VRRVEALLNREIGLCAGSIGRSAIECGMRGRMLASGCDSVDEYVQRLEQSLDERRALVEDIVVSETWFFRDEDVFRVLTEYSGRAWRRSRSEGSLRVLSIPCATGEEAYSASITLLEAGLTQDRYCVEALDVSERALKIARLGIFGKNSFRGASSPERERYFRVVSAGKSVIEDARTSVRFAQGNVLDPFTAPAASFNVIFCRNLLIYLDRAARSRALDNIYNWLVPDGLLFAGHAEALETMEPRFQRGNDAGHFGYVKRQTARATTELPGLAKPLAPQPLKKSKGAPEARKPTTTPARERQFAGAAPTSLTAARELADRGDLASAAATCERYVQESGADAEAFCLLGIVRTALGETERALECFNKAVYLDPKHHTALIHLALAHERRGETAAAQNFRRRAEHALRKGAGT